MLVWFGCEILLADVLGLDEVDAKSLILGRQTWKMYKENNLKGRLPSYRELKRMSVASSAQAGGTPAGHFHADGTFHDQQDH